MTKKARIYKPARTAMQQGRAKTQEWMLEYEPELRRRHDPLMGWTSSGDTRQQIRLYFDTREAAVSYAEKLELDYQIRDPQARRMRIQSYADNFRWDRAR